MLHLTDLGLDLAYASGKHSKKCEKPWFSQENHLQRVHFPKLNFQEGNLLWRQEETAYERGDNLALCNGIVAICINLHQFAKPLHVSAPPHSTTGLLQHVKRLSTASANKTERRWKKKPSSTFHQKYSQLPLQLARVAGLAKTFPEVLSLSTMPPRLPRRTWNYVKVFVTFPRHCITLKWLGGRISLAMCVLALKIFHLATLMECFDMYLPCSLLIGESSAAMPLDRSWAEFFDFVRFCEWDPPLV